MRRTRAGLLWRVVARAARTGDWSGWTAHLQAETAAAESPAEHSLIGDEPAIPLDVLLSGSADGARVAAGAAEELARGLAFYLESLPVGERVRSAGRVAALLHLVTERTPLDPFAFLGQVPEGDQASIWDAVLRSLVAQQGDPAAVTPWLAHLGHLPAALRPRWREQLLELDLPRAVREQIDHMLEPPRPAPEPAEEPAPHAEPSAAHEAADEPSQPDSDDLSASAEEAPASPPEHAEPPTAEAEPPTLEAEPPPDPTPVAAPAPAPVPDRRPVFTDRETMPLPRSLVEASLQAFAPLGAKPKRPAHTRPEKPPTPTPAFPDRETAELPRSLIEASLRAMVPEDSPAEIATLVEDELPTREEEPDDEAARASATAPTRRMTTVDARAEIPDRASRPPAAAITGTTATGPRMPRLAPRPDERGVEEVAGSDPDLVSTQRELPVLRLAESVDEEAAELATPEPAPAPVVAEEPRRRPHRRRSREHLAVAEPVELRGAFADKPVPRFVRVLGVLTGLIVVAAVFRVLARFALGWRREGQLKLDEGRITVDSTTFLLGREIRQVRRSFGPRGLLSVVREVRFPYFFLFLGLFALCLGTLAGTIAFLDGRLAGFETWMRVGLLLVLGGLLIDFIFAVVAHSRPGRTTVILTFEPRTTVRLIGVDRAEADRVLDVLTKLAQADASPAG